MTYCDEATGLTKEKSMACVLRLSMDESTGPTNKKSMACMDESTGPKKKKKKIHGLLAVDELTGPLR